MSKRELAAISAALSLLLGAFPARAAGDASKGKAIFAAKCLECHNTDSKEVKVGPGLKGVKDGKLPSGKAATHDNVLDNINKGSDTMPSFKDELKPQEKDDVIAYELPLKALNFATLRGKSIPRASHHSPDHAVALAQNVQLALTIHAEADVGAAAGHARESRQMLALSAARMVAGLGNWRHGVV